MNTEATGVVGHANCVSYCARNGFTPFVPYTDTSPKQDIIGVDAKGRIATFQVKATKEKNPKGKWEFQSVATNRNAKGVRRVRIDKKLIDYLFLSCPEFDLCIPTRGVKIPSNFVLGKKSKWFKYKVER